MKVTAQPQAPNNLPLGKEPLLPIKKLGGPLSPPGRNQTTITSRKMKFNVENVQSERALESSYEYVTEGYSNKQHQCVCD